MARFDILAQKAIIALIMPNFFDGKICCADLLAV
jgi:hypothetical protein